MKQHFEETLRVFSDVAKEKSDEPLREVSNRLQEKELEEMVPESARVQVLELQEKKQEIMRWLHKKIEAIDRQEEVRSIHKENEENKDYYVDENMAVEWRGEKVPVTKGDIVTDGEWDLLYKLDKAIPRDVKKEFVVAEAKRAMRDLLDKQIAETENEREIPMWADEGIKKHMEGLKIFYGGILGTDFRNLPWEQMDGLIAEKMITTTMEKFKIDNNASYKFFHGDASDDAERKLDCYLVIPEHTRGVKTKTDDREDIGIQLLVGPKKATKEQIEKKKRQIKKSKREFGLEDINDLVLVNIPYLFSKVPYDTWKEQGRKPGGPEKLWDDATQEKVFYGILKGFFEESMIDDIWKGSGKMKRNTEVFPEEKPDPAPTPSYGVAMEGKIREVKHKIKKGNKTENKDNKKPSTVKINGLDQRLKSLLQVSNPSKKTQSRIKEEIGNMKQRINVWSHMPNPSEKVKNKLDLEKQTLAEVLKLFPGEKKENEIEENKQTDEEKIIEIKQKIEKETEKVKSTQPKLTSGEISKMADELLREERKGEINGTSEGVKKFEEKYGKWFEKKKE